MPLDFLPQFGDQPLRRLSKAIASAKTKSRPESASRRRIAQHERRQQLRRRLPMTLSTRNFVDKRQHQPADPVDRPSARNRRRECRAAAGSSRGCPAIVRGSAPIGCVLRFYLFLVWQSPRLCSSPVPSAHSWPIRFSVACTIMANSFRRYLRLRVSELETGLLSCQASRRRIF